MKHYQEKQNKLLKTVKAARGRIQEINSERDQVRKSSLGSSIQTWRVGGHRTTLLRRM